MQKWVCLLVLLAAVPASAGVRADLRQGGKLYKDKKYGQALSAYTQILQKDPQNADASFGAGAASYFLKDYAAAEKAFENAAEQQETLAQDALFNLGNAYYREGNTQKAAQAYREAIVKNPQDKEAIHNLQLVLQQQNQQNENDQNQQNQDQDSQNQSQQNQDGKGQAQDQQNPQQPSNPQDAMDKTDAERVMQMARENEYKKPTQAGAAMGETVEKDW